VCLLCMNIVLSVCLFVCFMSVSLSVFSLISLHRPRVWLQLIISLRAHDYLNFDMTVSHNSSSLLKIENERRQRIYPPNSSTARYNQSLIESITLSKRCLFGCHRHMLSKLYTIVKKWGAKILCRHHVIN